jgi:hypothetical protein
MGLISMNLLWLKCLVRKEYLHNIDLGYTWRLWECIYIGIFVVVNFRHFAKKYFLKDEYSVHNFPVFFKIKKSSENVS